MQMLSAPHLSALKIGLDGLQFRQRVISSNVANIDSPGYKTKDVDFAKVFEAHSRPGNISLRRTNSGHMNGFDRDTQFSSAIYNAYRPENPKDGVNDVDLDREMIKTSETSMNIKMFGKLLKDKYVGIRTIIDSTP